LVLAFVLLAGASFFLSHLARLHASPLGFDPARVATLNIVIPDDKRADLPQHIAGLVAEAGQRIARLDGVDSVSAVSLPPLTSTLAVADFAIAGRDISPADRPLAEPHIVAPDYFRTMGIAVQAGRDFAATDTASAAPVVVVNETLAKRFFPGESALGRRITPGLYVDPLGPVEREIIGVVGDVASDLTSTGRPPQLYVPLPQCMWLDLTLVVRSNWAPDELLRAIEDVVTKLDPNVAVADRRTMTERVARAAATPRMNSALLSIFAAVAVALTAIGVYGVMAYSVAQRRHDLGIRLALGAQKQDVFRLVLGEGVRIIGRAILLGAAITMCLLPGLHGIIGDTAPQVPIVCFTAILLSVVSLLACWVPARRAASLDPLEAIEGR
jgi:putative ABC transport system permease protein